MVPSGFGAAIGVSEPTIARLESADGELADEKLPPRKFELQSKLPVWNLLRKTVAALA
jgi:hypothetical protein